MYKETQLVEQEPLAKRFGLGAEIQSFTTEKGSIYRYSEQGHTSRFKKATNEKLTEQDITVFANLDDKKTRVILDAIFSENPDLKRQVYVLEQLPDSKPKIIRKLEEVADPTKLYLGLVKDGKLIGAESASLLPQQGFTVFDTRHYQDDHGQWQTERHLGHKVVSIEMASEQ